MEIIMAKKPIANTGKARVIKSFVGVPDGRVYPHEYHEGDVIEGDLAAIALREKWAEPADDSAVVTDKEKEEADIEAAAANPEIVEE